jgi:hypothetical protein
MSSPVYLTIAFYILAIAISFLVAAMIRAVVVVLPRLGRREAAAVQPAAVPAQATGVPAQDLAAIAAAVSVMVRSRHVIHIEAPGRETVWTAEGRMIHQTSHGVAHSQKR